MAAYFIVDIDIRDAAGLEEYRNRIPATLTKYGGRPLKAMRFKASNSNVILVEGV